MSNEEKARRIVNAVGGDYNECLDWLNDGDGDAMSVAEAIREWVEVGKTYSA